MKKSIFFTSSYSNSQFELIRFKNQIYLKKIINNPNYRDFQSIKKNNFFSKNIKIKNLKTNFIESKDFKDLKKNKFIVMKYIEGLSGSLIPQNIGLREVKLLKEFFRNYFINIIKLNKWEKFNKKIFSNKIKEVKRNIKNEELIKLFKIYEKNLVKKLNYIKFYPSGICRGDLTLSNIIISNNKIYLIDFLKTYNDSVLIDLAKVFQEFILGWSSRYLSNNLMLRSKIINENILDMNFFKSLPKLYSQVLKFEAMLTLIRIFPYVKDRDTVTILWLKKSLKKIDAKL